MPDAVSGIRSVFFYGSGVRPELEQPMCDILAAAFPSALTIDARSDLYGAAIALCGGREGIACILGTGANSCLFDGKHIIQNTPALGYILGDEGSGAVLGRLFFNALYKGALPVSLREEFETETGLTMSAIINKVYREPLANRFLASLSPFIHARLFIPELRSLVIDNFRTFLRKNIAPYRRPDLPVNAVGSVAYYYSAELHEAASLEGFTIGKILRSPLDGMADIL